MFFDRKPAASSPRTSILLVEDEAIVLIDFAEAFRVAGFDILLAANLEAGRSLARRHAGALSAVCIDLGLPDGRGESLVDEIAAAAPHAAIFICSAYPPEEIACAALESGRARLLKKPIGADAVLREIRRSLALPGWAVGH